MIIMIRKLPIDIIKMFDDFIMCGNAMPEVPCVQPGLRVFQWPKDVVQLQYRDQRDGDADGGRTGGAACPRIDRARIAG